MKLSEVIKQEWSQSYDPKKFKSILNKMLKEYKNSSIYNREKEKELKKLNVTETNYKDILAFCYGFSYSIEQSSK